MRRILMIAYHFPPLAGSSGIQRTLRFAQHLPALGWQPLVLSAQPLAYEKVSDDMVPEVPADMVVRRAFALDTARHLSIKGRYFGWMARPDRWVSWRFDAVRQGLRMVREFKPDVIWSTYPLATAHLIGAALCRRTGLPWVADFRDPMAQDIYPADPLVWKSFKHIEEVATDLARLCVFSTPGAARVYQERYPAARDRIVTVENGFDEESFLAVESQRCQDMAAQGKPKSRRIVLLHSGIVYRIERDPTQLFIALARLRESGKLDPDDLLIRFRAPVEVEMLQAMAVQYQVQDFIEIAPAVGYRDALAEMMSADTLLVMQSAGCNEQIPTKLYEYLRAGRPILALADPAGDTAAVLRQAGMGAIARLESADEIARTLPAFVHEARIGSAIAANPDYVGGCSRRRRSADLAKLLDRLVDD